MDEVERFIRTEVQPITCCEIEGYVVVDTWRCNACGLLLVSVPQPGSTESRFIHIPDEGQDMLEAVRLYKRGHYTHDDHWGSDRPRR